MNKRWFAVILTIGLLLCLVPLSAFALNGDCITDSDGNILGWEDLTDSDLTDPDPVDMVWEQAPAPASTASDTPTQPHPPAETNDVQNSAAAGSSEVQMTSAESEFNTDELYPDELYAVSAVDVAASTTEPAEPAEPAKPAVCEISGTTYTSLQSAINAANDNDQIDLLQDIKWDKGLTFYSKKLTISGGGTRTLTLNEKGMYASHSDITFEDLTLNIYAATHSYEGGAGCTANLITDSDLTMNSVYFTLAPNDSSVSGTTGSGIYLHRYSNLYLNGTIAEIHGFSGVKCSGIFADESNIDYDVDPVENRKIELVGSTLTVTDCGWNGMTINPVDLSLTGSQVYLNHNGKGGLGTYWGKLTMVGSTLTADDNGNGSDDFSKTWGLFVDQLDMDGSSTLNACNNHGVAGILIGDGGVIRSGAELNCSHNDYIGLYVFLDRANEWFGNVVIEPGATVTACENAFSGVHNANKLQIEGTVIADSNKVFGITNDAGDKLIITSTADVSACQNLVFGIFNYDNANLTVNSGASLKVEENTGSGILNGRNATLNLNAGSIQRNNARYAIQGYVAHGGGIQNCGTATLSDDVELYNNHAVTCGDDIYNADGATITFGDTGEGWALDGAPDCYDDIDGWYDDSTNTRWNAHAEDEADLHTVLADSGTFNSVLALKAAHGPIGTLIISKEIAGALEPDDCGTDFNFVLTLADSSITTTDAEKYGVVFEDGKAAFTLKDSESITIANLPDGMSYTLAEQSKGGWRLAWVDGDAEGVVSRHKAAAITFINEKLPTTGSLVISKQVTGDLNPEDADTVFHFVLMLDDNTLTTADAEEYGVAFESGWASFTLKGGESITIGGLPAGVGYTIAETRQNGWTLQSVSGETTGVIPQNGTVEITFVNQKNDGSIPVAPVDPVDPVDPVEPVEPDMPAETETPAEPVTPEVPETPVQDEAPVPSQTPEAPAKADASVSTLPQTGTNNWLAGVLMSFGSALLACGWFLTRRQRRVK